MKKVFQTTLTEDELVSLIQRAITGLNKSNNEKDELFIDVHEAAGFLKYKPGYIYQLIHKTDIPHHKSGKSLLFKKKELEAWDQRRKTAEMNK